MSKKFLYAVFTVWLSLMQLPCAQALPSQLLPRLGKVKVLNVDTGNGCAIRILDRLNGHAASGAPGGMPGYASYWTDKPPIKTQIDKFRLVFQCIYPMPKNINDIAHQYGAEYDQNKKKWVAYYVSTRDRGLLASVSRIYAVKAINATGFVRTTDETLGDPTLRVRFSSYCLFHENKSLCGNGQVMMLADPKGNLLPYALAVLRSIEFIDAPSSTSAPHTA